MEVKAISRNLSVSPKKLGPIVATVRGKPVAEALALLQFMPSPVAADIAKVVKSAAANAENNYQLNADRLRVTKITADGGLKLKRFMPMSRGRAGRVNKRHSHITVVVEEA